MPLKKIIFIFFIFLLARLFIEIAVIRIFEKKEDYEYIHDAILNLKYKLIKPVFLEFEGLSYKQLENIRLYPFSFKDEKVTERIFTEVAKDYFFYRKIVFAVPRDIFPDIKKVKVLVDKKEFNYDKKELLDKWQKRETNDGKFIFTAPSEIKINSIIPRLLFFSPQLVSIINWDDKALFIFLFFIIAHFCLPLLMMMMIFSFLIKLDFKTESKNIKENSFKKQKKIFIISVLSILGTVLLLSILITIIPLIYHPDLSKIKEIAYKETILLSEDTVPEPVERMQYLLAVFFSPLFILGTYFLGKRIVKKIKLKMINNVYYVLTYTSVFMMIIFVNFLWLRNYESFSYLGKINNLKSSFFQLGISLLLLFSFYILIILLIKNLSRAAVNKIFNNLLLIFASVIIIFMILSNTYNFDQTHSDQKHFDAVFYSVSQVMAGKTLLVNFLNQYGLYPHFLEPIFKIIGFSMLKFSFVMGLLVGISFLFLFLTIKKVIVNNLLGFLGFVSIIYFSFIVRLNWDYDVYYQFWPIRFFFPSLVIFLTSLYFTKRSRFLYYLVYMVSSVAVLWNMDTGLVVFFSWLLVLFYSEFLPFNLKKITYHLFSGIVIFLLTVMFYGLSIFLRSGTFPNFLEAFFYQKIFYLSGYFMIPMPLFHAWNLIILLYLIGLLYSIKRVIISKNHNLIMKDKIIFFLSVLGLGVFSYYQGRSHNYVLGPVTYPAVMLLTIYADNLWDKIKQYQFKLTDQVLYFSTIIFIFSIALNSLIEKRSQLDKYIKKGLIALQNDYHSHSLIKQNINFIKNHTKEGEKVFILSKFLAGIYYAESQTESALDIPGFIELYLKKDVDSINSFFVNNNGYKVFLEKNIVTTGSTQENILDNISQKLLTNSNYRITNVSNNGLIWLLEKKQ